MPQQTPAQQRKIHKVMHEFKEGELKSGNSHKKVRNPKQAIAIALSEAGASKPPSKRAKTGHSGATGKAVNPKAKARSKKNPEI